MNSLIIQEETLTLTKTFVGDDVLPTDESGRQARYTSQSGPAARYIQATRFQPDLISINGPMLAVKHVAKAVARPDIALPAVEHTPAMPLSLAMMSRRSDRYYGPAIVSLQQLSTLLAIAAGASTDAPDKRHYPSGGGYYPVNLYLVVRSVSGLTAGAYRYVPEHHGLNRVSDDVIIDDPALAGLLVPNASMMMFLTHDLTHQYRKYGELSYKLALLEAGHLAQNICLAMEALALKGCPLQTYFNDHVDQNLNLDTARETVCYGIEIGSKH